MILRARVTPSGCSKVFGKQYEILNFRNKFETNILEINLKQKCKYKY